MPVLGTQTGQELPIHPIAGKGEGEGDLILAREVTDDAAGFDDFRGLIFLGEGVEFGVAAGMRAENKALGLHFKDLGAGQERLLGAEVAGDIYLKKFADLIEEGFGGLLVVEYPLFEGFGGRDRRLGIGDWGKFVENVHLGNWIELGEFFEGEGHFSAVIHGLIVDPVGGEEEEAGNVMFEEEMADDGITFGKPIVKGKEGGRFGDSAIQRFGEGDEFRIADQRVVLFEGEEVLLEFGGGFGWVEMFEVGKRCIRNGVVEEPQRVVRAQTAVCGQRNVGGDDPGHL